jgi:hypothetical protein
MTHPRYVLHDGEKWRVNSVINIDGDPGFTLGRGSLEIVARQAECEPIEAKARVRRFRADDIVLEFDSRGGVAIRRARSSKRYRTSLAAIFSMTVKASINMEKALAKSKKRKFKRGML